MPKTVFSNTNLWLKIIVSPMLLLLTSFFFSEQIKFSVEYYPIMLGLVFALLAGLLEKKFYQKDKITRLTVIDFFIAFSLVYLVGKGLSLLGMASVNHYGALIYAAAQAIFEHLHHLGMRPRKKKWRKEKRRK
ncbi:MAG: hypothetical protein ABRQ26_08980 [Syntrophomonadaceae bacterium]